MSGRRSPALTVATAVIYAFLVVYAVLTLIPFLWMITAALKTKADFFSSVFLPRGDGFLGFAWDHVTLDNFRALLLELPVGRAVVNSFFLASVISLTATLLCSMGGYALSKFEFRGREAITTAVLGAVIVPTPLLLAPGFELVYHLGLLDTFAGFMLPALAPAFGVFLFRQAMLNSVPAELIESARLDGCGEIRIFFTLVLPLVRPMIGAYLILAFLGVWNNFVGPQLILQSSERQTLAVAMNILKGVYGTDYGLVMAGTLCSIAPIMCLFLLLQKEFISGLTSGAVKG
jgi:ABC-type glycerol-3-phosphate transport system permease component